MNKFKGSVTPTSCPSPGDLRHNSSNNGSQTTHNLPEYESGATPNKRPRISEGWAT